MVPFITRKTTFGQHVSELVFGVDVLDLDFGVQINSIEQPIKCNSVGSGHVSHRWTSALNDHLDHGFVVFEHIQLRLTLSIVLLCGHVVHMRLLLNISFALFSSCYDLGFIDGMVSCPAQVSWGSSTLFCSVLC